MGHYNNNFSALLYVVLVLVVSNQQNENREESVRRNRIFSHRRPRPQLEVEFSGLFLLQSSMEAVTEVYHWIHYAVVSSFSTLTILKLLSQHMRTERASWYWKLWIMRCKKMWSDLILYSNSWPKKSVNVITKFIQTVRFIKISKYLCMHL